MMVEAATNCGLVIDLPSGFELSAAVCSYGFMMLAPNSWDPLQGEFSRPLRLQNDTAVMVTIRQAAPQRLEVHIPAKIGQLCAADELALKEQVVRMLRLFEADADVARRFAALCPDLATGGPVGRLFRSPSLFEDLVKTVTLCNCGWSRTISMNQALCKKIGKGAFPTARELARVSPRSLQRSCGVGYRAERIVHLARACFRGKVDLSAMDASGATTEVEEQIEGLYGFGPFAVANALQLLGNYEHIPADSETVRHLTQVRRCRGVTLENVQNVATRVYKKYAPFQFLRYWTELWRAYETRMGGLASEVRPEQFKLLTAAHMNTVRPRCLKRRPLGRPAGTVKNRGMVMKTTKHLKRPLAKPAGRVMKR